MITGYFIEECKNRFLCLVNVDGCSVECYVPSSSKLGKLISLQNRRVMLINNVGKKLRTKYTLHAVYKKNRWVLLNLNIINDLVFDALVDSYNGPIKREHYVGNYKSDFYCQESKEVIEVKGILSDDETVSYPSASSGRHLRQLCAIEQLLKDGYSVKYIFVIMNSVTRNIILNKQEQDLVMFFNKCLVLGMQLVFFSPYWENDKFCLKRIPNNQITIS